MGFAGAQPILRADRKPGFAASATGGVLV